MGAKTTRVLFGACVLFVLRVHRFVSLVCRPPKISGPENNKGSFKVEESTIGPLFEFHIVGAKTWRLSMFSIETSEKKLHEIIFMDTVSRVFKESQ